MLYAWIDLETTGLDPIRCSICEIACIVTDDNFREEKAVFTRVVDSREAYWQAGAMGMHLESGLLREMDKGIAEEEAINDLDEWLKEVRLRLGLEDKRYDLAGSSVHFDRRFLVDRWPYDFEELFTHRNMDVSSTRSQIRSFCGDEIAFEYDDTGNGLRLAEHRALADIRHSIGQLLHYRDKGLIGGPKEIAHG